MDTMNPASRAVSRRIAAGSSAICAHCGNPVKLSARIALIQVIANV